MFGRLGRFWYSQYQEQKRRSSRGFYQSYRYTACAPHFSQSRREIEIEIVQERSVLKKARATRELLHFSWNPISTNRQEAKLSVRDCSSLFKA